MNEVEYAALAARCDRLLNAADTSLARIANPLLHMVSEHPGWIERYQPLVEPNARSRLQRDALPRLSRTGARVARGIWRAWRTPADSATGGREPVDVMLVSRAATDAQLAAAEDFYFGPMRRLFETRGWRCLVVLIDHRQRAAPLSGARAAGAPYLLPRHVGLRAELGLWNDCRRERRQLLAAARQAGDESEQALALLAAEHARSEATAHHLRMHARLAEFCRLARPRLVITTFEGDASERLIFDAARRPGHSPLCVGYQHAPLLPLAHAIGRPVRAAHFDGNPDVILTQGSAARARLAASGLADRPLILYGSHRHRTAEASPSAVRRRRCLVLLGNSIRECDRLVSFATRCAQALPEWEFSLRPHPSTDVASLLRRQAGAAAPPANLRLDTDATFELSCADVQLCLYRGSAAAIYAALAGVRVLHYSMTGELSFDPLAGLEECHATVRSVDEFAAAARGFQIASAPALERVREFCGRVVAPLRPAAIDELLALLVPANDAVRPARSGA